MNCPKCKKSDEVDIFHTIEPQTLDEIKSYVCLRCMYVIESEGTDIESILHQVKEIVRWNI